MSGEYTRHDGFVSLEFEHWALGVGFSDGSCAFRFYNGVYDLADEASFSKLNAAVRDSINLAILGPVLVNVDEPGVRHMARGAQNIVEAWVGERRDR